MAHSTCMVSRIKEHVAFLTPVQVYPGEYEMEVLCEGAAHIMKAGEEAKHFKKRGQVYQLVEWQVHTERKII